MAVKMNGNSGEDPSMRISEEKAQIPDKKSMNNKPKTETVSEGWASLRKKE